VKLAEPILSAPPGTMTGVSRRDVQAPFVGRGRQLDVLRSALVRAATGEPGAVLLAGDAGVGKTRLLLELIAHATASGATVLVGHCLDIGEVGLPYLPFTEALGYLAAGDGDGRPPGPWSALAAAGGEAGQLRVFESVLQILTRAGETGAGPVVLVLEDLHWADRSSRDLLAFLLARLRHDRLLVVASYRSDDLHRRHPLRPLLAQLARSPVVERLDLPGFDPAEMAAYLGGVSGTELEDSLVRRILDRSQGNAYYARELWESHDSSAAAGAADPVLPTELSDLLLLRFEQLPPDAQRVARAAAVGRRPVGHPLLLELTGLADRELEAALHEAVAQQVLVAVDGRHYAFRHALLSEAVYADLLPGERVRLHSAYARAIAAAGMPTGADPAGAGDRPGSAAELAHHAMASHDLPGALVASMRAAGEATDLDAPAEAWQQLERALQLWDAVPDAADRTGLDIVEVGLRAAATASRAGAHDRAAALAEAATGRLDPAADPDRAAEVWVAQARHMLDADRPEAALRAATEAVRLAGGPARVETPAVAWSVAHSANALRQLDRAGARELAEQARDVARRTGTPAAEADALVTLAALDNDRGSVARVALLLAEAGERARTAGDLTTELRVSYALAADRYDAGDLAGALVLLDAAVERGVGNGAGWSPYGLELRALQVTARFVSGDWAGSAAAAAVAQARPPEQAAARMASVGLHVAVARGERSAAGTLAQLEVPGRADPMVALPAAGCGADLAGWSGQPATALDIVVRALGHLQAAFDPWFLGALWLCALGISAAADLPELARRERDPAREHTARAEGERLLDFARRTTELGHPRSGTLGPEGIAWFRRAEAERHRLHGDGGADAVAAWRSTVEAFGYGHVYEQARSRWRLAAALLGAGDRDEAAVEASLAHTAAGNLGAVPLAAAIEDLARRGRLVLGSGPRARVASPADASPLTRREQEVVLLLASGRSNRQIGEELFMAEKTASVHVSRILAKLSATSRAEAVAHAYDRGLLG
jgi:DNA-binding CsgD family transcriptional regulator/tetratricopeptide (TPR) repeat protein